MQTFFLELDADQLKLIADALAASYGLPRKSGYTSLNGELYDAAKELLEIADDLLANPPEDPKQIQSFCS